jgi:hypothetical protein
VQGNISGASIAIAGSVSGDLTGTEAVSIESGARVIGDLRAPRIAIGDGAHVRGSVQTSEVSGGAAQSASLGTTRNAALARPATRSASARSGLTSSSLGGSAMGGGQQRAARPAPAAAQASARPKDEEPEPADRAVKRAAPPPPVVSAPKAGAKGRKKRAKGD